MFFRSWRALRRVRETFSEGLGLSNARPFSDFSSGRVAKGLILSRGRRNGPRAETLTMSACSLVIHGHWAWASICVRYMYTVNVLHARWRQAVKEAVQSIKTNNGLTPKS